MHEHEATHARPAADTDPVCGMQVGRDATIQIRYRGVAYRFCDQACADTFRDDPDRWAGPGQGFHHEHAH